MEGRLKELEDAKPTLALDDAWESFLKSPNRPDTLSERVKRIFRSAGIETATTGQDGPRKRALVSFHSLRHTFVSMSANAGVPLAVVQSIVGHATADMTRHYYHESQGALVPCALESTQQTVQYPLVPVAAA